MICVEQINYSDERERMSSFEIENSCNFSLLCFFLSSFYIPKRTKGGSSPLCFGSYKMCNCSNWVFAMHCNFVTGWLMHLNIKRFNAPNIPHFQCENQLKCLKFNYENKCNGSCCPGAIYIVKWVIDDRVWNRERDREEEERDEVSEWMRKRIR